MKTPRSTKPPAPKQVFDPVDPMFILKGIAAVVVASFICGYLTLCFLLYQGQWQLVLHPTANTTSLSTLAGLPAQPVRFDALETGTPSLSGALIPAPSGSRFPTYTVLYLRGGDSALAQSPTDARILATLHTVGLNLFAFDYRGYGQSDPTHPNQVRMTEDARAALKYLTDSRATPPTHILLYGSGLGASLATTLAAENPRIPAIILDSPGSPPITLALADPRTGRLPVHTLFHENFSLEGLSTLPTPKLLISYPTPTAPRPTDFQSAKDPKTTLELAPEDKTHQAPTITRFLDQTIPHEVQTITP